MKKKMLIIILLMLVFFAVIFVLVNNTNVENEEETIENTNGNYIERPDGSIENINERVIEGETIRYIEISNVNLIYQDYASKFRAEVKNNKEEKIDLKLKVYFMVRKSNETISKKIDIGKIEAGKVKDIDFTFTENLSDTYMIRYEIID